MKHYSKSGGCPSGDCDDKKKSLGTKSPLKGKAPQAPPSKKFPTNKMGTKRGKDY